MNATAAARRRRRLRVHRFKGSQPRPVHRCTDGNLRGRGRFVKSTAVVIGSRPRGAAAGALRQRHDGRDEIHGGEVAP